MSTKTQATDTMPLFFKNPVPLDATRHAKAGLVTSQDVAFAATANSLPINIAEFIEVAKLYPIVFTEGENAMPIAVTGLEQQNYFVGSNGRWREGAYIPAYVRRYPFIFMEVSQQKQFLLCVDEGAVQFREKAGKDAQPLYDGTAPSALTKNALEFCKLFQDHYQITVAFCDAVKKAGLLTSMRSNIKLFNGREISLGGFQAIDEKKLGTLTDAQVLDLHKKGWLPLIHFAMMSASNWQSLTNLAAAREKKA